MYVWEHLITSITGESGEVNQKSIPGHVLAIRISVLLILIQFIQLLFSLE